MFETIIKCFDNLEQHPLQRLAFLVGGLMFFWILEGAIPLLKLNYKRNKWQHAGVNFLFTIIHLVIHTFLALIIIKISDWCRANEFGFVYWIKANTLSTIIISFLFLDFFGGWLVHWVEHNVAWMWQFHIVHHSDTNVDVTSGLRHHPGESIIRGIFFFAGIFVSGAPMYAVMIFQTILVLATAFTHANISLPEKFDKLLSYFFISPNMHKVHHHWKRPYTDTNYGAILSIWDRFLGTYSFLPTKEIRYGIDNGFDETKDENVGALMKRPLRFESYK